MTFYRMIIHWGIPEEIYSINGTYFTGADNELNLLVAQLDKDNIKESIANKGI